MWTLYIYDNAYSKKEKKWKALNKRCKGFDLRTKHACMHAYM